MNFSLRAALLGGLALSVGSFEPSWAQQARQPDNAPAATAPATTDRDRSAVVNASELESGANSFTEGQTRRRMEDAGFTNLQDLRKDDAGFWRARATHDGQSTEVAMDFRGRIASGPAVANLGSSTRRGDEPTGSTTRTSPSDAASSRDGTPGNPPSTMTGRAVDRMQGETPRPDGTPGNPPGTAAGRALDRATDGNTTGANPNPPATTGGGSTR
jgi:hypothetical protein